MTVTRYRIMGGALLAARFLCGYAVSRHRGGSASAGGGAGDLGVTGPGHSVETEKAAGEAGRKEEEEGRSEVESIGSIEDDLSKLGRAVSALAAERDSVKWMRGFSDVTRFVLMDRNPKREIIWAAYAAALKELLRSSELVALFSENAAEISDLLEGGRLWNGDKLDGQLRNLFRKTFSLGPPDPNLEKQLEAAPALLRKWVLVPRAMDRIFTNPEETAAVLDGVSPDLRADVELSVIRSMVASDRVKALYFAMDHARSLSGSDLQNVDLINTSWIDENPQDVAEALSTAGRSPAYDLLVARCAEMARGKSPEEARLWLEKIADPRLRSEFMSRLPEK